MNNNNKKVASSGQEEKKMSPLAALLLAKEFYSETVGTLDFLKFIILIWLRICQFGLDLLIKILPSLQQFVEFLISILSCISKEGFFVSSKPSI